MSEIMRREILDGGGLARSLERDWTLDRLSGRPRHWNRGDPGDLAGFSLGAKLVDQFDNGREERAYLLDADFLAPEFCTLLGHGSRRAGGGHAG